MDLSKAPSDTKSQTQPSCELCQRRKVRCDKANPCSTCQRAGVKCEVLARRRLPRGRNGGRRKGDTDLKARIAKLENLVSSMGGETTSLNQKPSSEPGPHREPTTQEEPSSDMSRYLGSSFWSSLSGEVHGLREILDQSDESDPETPERSETASSPPGVASQGFNFVLCGPNSWMLSPNALDNPPRHMIEIFFNLYFQNVDPLFKVLHRPSVAERMINGNQYLDYRLGDPAVEALSFAIYYAALNTLDTQNCKQRFGEEKTDLLNRYRFAFEVNLARADFINSTDILPLQAFVIFLASVRVNDRSRWSWTLLALAVRLAQAHGLFLQEGRSPRKPFDREMRCRLWHQVGVLDINNAIDRGSDPMILSKFNSINIPANVNDEDISPHMENPVTSRDGFTDMSFCLMSHDGEPLIRDLIFQDGSTSGERPDIEQSQDQKQEMVRKYERSMNEKYLKYCDMNIAFHWFAKRVGEVMTSASMLYAMRPLQINTSVKAPRTDELDILELAVDLLVKHREIATNPVTEPWRWFVWVQWHALAVALAELCSRTEGRNTERAWEVVDEAFQLYGPVIADTERGMLWQPIEKLMKKAKQNRRTAQMANLSLEDQSSRSSNHPASTPTSVQPDYSSSNPTEQLPSLTSPLAGMPNLLSNQTSTGWNTGILAPVSREPNVSSMTEPSLNNFAPNPSFSTAAPSLDPIALSSTDDTNFPMDMAWTNWEDFVGEVNLSDFDMIDPAAGFPSQ